ncbi:MAG: NAD(P)-binding protein [Blastochloris sp.]|nr:NAD(P)-binding protein [Blastochloris sp.]
MAIIGGGMAGLTLAWQLKQTRPGLRMLVIEKQAHPVPEAAHKVGESTVEIAAHYLRDVLGLAEHLQTQQLPKFGLRIFASFHDNSDITQRVELGHAVPPPRGVGTYQLDRGRLENALGGQLAQKDIGFLDDCKVQQIVLQPQDECHCLHVLREGKLHKIQARWIVDASGRSAVLKRQLGLAKQVGHHANAVWFRIAHPIDINTWSTDPDWHARIREGERSLSTNHLMGTGYWVWLIRLASDSTSIGIVADANVYPFEHMNRFDRALAWLQQHEPQCAAIVEHHRDQVQDFRVMKDYAYSCEQVYSQDRWCLTGEAGVSLDPLYSPGGDLIAISNGLICDLITRDIAGEDIEERAAIHNQFFLILVNSWLGIYEQQYALMDNARIMVAKVIWDTAVYWAIPGLLYFHDKFRDFVDSPGMVMNLLRFSLLSDHVQAFFRAWHTIDHSVAHDTSIRYYDFDFMEQLHIGMRAGLDDGALEQQFATNVRFLEQLAGQLVSVVIDICEEQSNQPEVHHCIERWRTDPFLAELMTIYQQDRDIHPIDAGWITLGESLRNQEELVR